MLKNSFNILLNNSFMKSLNHNRWLKNLFFENGRISLRSHFPQTRHGPVFCQICLASSKTFSNKSYNNKEPIILMSGILTFLGLKEASPEEKESELVLTMKRGILLMQRQQYNKAEQVLHVALKMAQDTNDADAITYIYDLLANVAFESDQPKKAEKIFVSVLQRLFAKGEPEDSNKVVHISLKLAKCFELMKEYSKAEKGYNFCIDTLSKKSSDGDEDTLALLGMTMDWYGKFLLGIGKTKEGFTKLQKAYEICVRINGMENEQTAVLLNDLGSTSSLLGDIDSAVAYLEQAINVGKKLPEMKYLASIHVNLGQLYLMKGLQKESIVSCNTGLRLAKVDNDTESIREAKKCLDLISKAFNKNDSKYSPKELRSTLLN